jgi:Holliday junction resolvase RusA-like endonuclease
VIRLTFPQPNRPLSINEGNKLHWAARRRRLEPWRDETLLALRGIQTEEGIEYPARISVQVTLTFPRAARRDPHNYTGTVVKTICDAIVASSLVPDDTAEWVVVLDPIIRIASDDTCTVTIERTK